MSSLAAGVAATSPGPQHRGDLGPGFGAVLCGDTGAPSNDVIKAWVAHVYDAQIDGRWLAQRHGLAIPLPDLAAKAKGLASLRGVGGYAYGVCKDAKRGWIMALPAPAPMRVEKSALELPAAAMAQRCSSVRADFAPRAPAKSAPTRTVAINRGKIATVGLGDGVLSVTCQPSMPRWQGPVLWYLYPVGNGPAAEVPAVAALSGATSMQALVPWIARLRSDAGLPVLAASEALSVQAANLADGGSLLHNRTALRTAERQLKERHIELLGEDRVKGANVAMMAWLLWNSPRHRSLLLNRDATSLGIATLPVGDEQLVVLVTGKAEVLSTAKAAPTVKERASRAR